MTAIIKFFFIILKFFLGVQCTIFDTNEWLPTNSEKSCERVKDGNKLQISCAVQMKHQIKIKDRKINSGLKLNSTYKKILEK